MTVSDQAFNKVFQFVGGDQTKYVKITSEHVSTAKFGKREVLMVGPEAIKILSAKAFDDVSHLLRTSHLESLSAILDDPEASDNDKYVATELLKNAVIASQRVFPSCQDTGTAIILGKKGENVFVEGDDEKLLSEGVYETYQKRNLRYSQLAPLSMFKEKNTGTNLPAQIDLLATKGNTYDFLFIAKGGGSANKSFLYQKTKSLLNPDSFREFIKEVLASLGTAACPPYHLAVVVGGMSAEQNLKTVKLASCKYYDELPREGDVYGRAYRDVEMEEEIRALAYESGIGAQFGGKYFVHDVRVIRLPRHGASCPVGVGVSCSADRQVKGKITSEGIFIEALEEDPARFLPENKELGGAAVSIDLNKSMSEILAQLSALKVSTRVMLNGPLIVARDIAHAKLLEHLSEHGDLPDYFKEFPVYYAGPAKTPQGQASGSFGPTTSQRMDPYVAKFQAHGGSMVMLGKGNRSKEVALSCAEHGGFYLGSIGGPAARLGKDCITKVEVLEYEELGMEAVWKIEVKDFPAFIITDDKGNDFFSKK